MKEPNDGVAKEDVGSGVTDELLAVAASAQDQKPARPDLPKLFEKKEVMIKMRDGVKLHTEIYTPRDAQEPLPMLMERTPYGISGGPQGYSGHLYCSAGPVCGRIHICVPGHSRTIWIRGQI